MIDENKEISALFHLMDDPDEDVFINVTNKIISIGKDIIPNLENLSENSEDEMVQDRVEAIIHKLHFRDLFAEFTEWKNNSNDLLDGALLVAKYHYPDLLPDATFKEIEKIRRNIWLELNSYLTPLEQINVVSGILFSYYKLQGLEVNYDKPEDFILTNTILSKRGNPITNGILYLILCDLLDISVKATNVPKQFILRHSSINLLSPQNKIQEARSFFIDPVNGQVYSQLDVENYLERSGYSKSTFDIKDLNNHQIVRILLLEFSKCFTSSKYLYKKNDLLILADLFNT
ncbi:MAG: transglutaminase family protein [Ginsengibacter sp.]|jgi:regulator of sirC expression with transglutaminase-like and TPR domain